MNEPLRPTLPEQPVSDAPATTVERTGRSALLARMTPGDIPLLPSNDHVVLVSLAVLVGLIAGLMVTLLRVAVLLCSALFFSPRRTWALLDDPRSPERIRFIEGTAGLDVDVVVAGALAAVVCFGYGLYRDRLRRRDPSQPWTGKHSRAYFVGLLLLFAAALHYALRGLLAASLAIMPGHEGLPVFADTPWWALGLVAVIGGALVGAISHRFLAPGSHGVPEVMEAVTLHGGSLPASFGPSYAMASGLTVAAMGSVGLEGPVIVFGAGSASTMGKALSLSRERLRVLVAGGAAAGIAAVFNAPIAGALFALEVVIGEFGLTMFSPVVIASVVGTVVHRSVEGSSPLLASARFELGSLYEILAYVPLGLFCGAVGTFFVRMLEGSRAHVARVLSPLPKIAWPAVGFGLLVAVAVIFHRYEVLGSGYDTLDALLDSRVVGTTVVLILAAKLVAIALTLSTGGKGGILLPSLFLGACAGSAYGSFLRLGLDDRVADPGAYALVGMGAVLTAVQHAPMTAVVMIFELCNDYSVILPLIVSCILSTLVSARALGLGVYQRALKAEGIVITRGKEQNVLRSLRVADAMQRDVITIPVATHLGALEGIVASSTQTTYPLVDHEGRLAGVLSLSDLRHVMFEHKDIDDLVVAGELGHKTVHVIRPSDHLGDALEELSVQQFENLVVVDDHDAGQVLGLLSHQAVMEAYRKALERAGLFERPSPV
jgi:CIC family chloride channel protein